MENSQTVFETRVFSKILFKGAQSRQSARLFSRRPNWDPPPPHTQASVSPPLWFRGDTLSFGNCGWGGVPIRTREKTL